LEDVGDGALVEQAETLAEGGVLILQRVRRVAAGRAVHPDIAFIPIPAGQRTFLPVEKEPVQCFGSGFNWSVDPD
jgi:hypothetical protein